MYILQYLSELIVAELAFHFHLLHNYLTVLYNILIMPTIPDHLPFIDNNHDSRATHGCPDSDACHPPRFVLGELLEDDAARYDVVDDDCALVHGDHFQLAVVPEPGVQGTGAPC